MVGTRRPRVVNEEKFFFLILKITTILMRVTSWRLQRDNRSPRSWVGGEGAVRERRRLVSLRARRFEKYTLGRRIFFFGTPRPHPSRRRRGGGRSRGTVARKSYAGRRREMRYVHFWFIARVGRGTGKLERIKRNRLIEKIKTKRKPNRGVHVPSRGHTHTHNACRK